LFFVFVFKSYFLLFFLFFVSCLITNGKKQKDWKIKRMQNKTKITQQQKK